MTFVEWSDKYGVESARRQFRLGDHMVFVVTKGKHVFGRCGNWTGSEPLAMGQTLLTAMEKLRASVCFCFDTEETILL